MGKTTKKTTEYFISNSKKIHGDKYDYSKVNYILNKIKVIIICPVHGEFKQLPTNHIRYGCAKCAGNIVKGNIEFIKEARKVHGDRFDYSKINYKNVRKKITIICLIHGAFDQAPAHHLRGHGCPACKPTRKKTVNEFIARSKKIHGDKYDYSKVFDINSKDKLTIICPVHGEYSQLASNHYRYGCSKCAGNKVKNHIEFIEEARKVHGDKFDYSKVFYKNCKEKIEIICNNCKTIFKQTPDSHIQGRGCKTCSKGNISMISQRWLDYHNIPNNLGLTREVKIKINNKFIIVDGYDPTTNTIFEFHGDIWHGNPRIYNPDDLNPVNKKKFGELFLETTKRSQLIRKAGYNLVSIWESDWEEKEKFLSLKQAS